MNPLPPEPPIHPNPTPGLDSASAKHLGELMEMGELPPDTPTTVERVEPLRIRYSFAGLVFVAVVSGLLAGIGWWSWMMASSGVELSAGPDTPDTIQSAPEPTPSAWTQVATATIPTDGTHIALEAAFNHAGDELLVSFSDGTTRRFSIEPGTLGPAMLLANAVPYPLALCYNAQEVPGLINQPGSETHHYPPDESPSSPIDPPVVEVYFWDAGKLITAAHPFDGSVTIQHGEKTVRLPGLRFAGYSPSSGVVLFTDRDDPNRVGILEAGSRTPRFIFAPAPVRRASIDPEATRITAALEDGAVVTVDAQTGAELWRRDAVPGVDRPRVFYTPSGDLMVAEHRLLLLEPGTGLVIVDLTPPSDLPLAAFDIVLSPDGRHLCVLGNDLHVLSLTP